MTDVHSKEVRSYNMSCIKSKNTKPEMLVRRFLHKNGLRYRLHVKNLPGKPDIVLPRFKVVIYVNGCFWHGHQLCNSYLKPKSNIEFWNTKIVNNVLRDARNMDLIKIQGWRVFVVWECELKKACIEKTLLNLLTQIRSFELI